MGNYKFRLSDMMPNAWFYKLRDMSKTRNHNLSYSVNKNLPPPNTTSQKPHFSHLRPSYYHPHPHTQPKSCKFHNSPQTPKFPDTQFPDPPRKSSQKKNKRKSIYKPSPRPVTSSVWPKPEPTLSLDHFFSSTETSPESDFYETKNIHSSSEEQLAAWPSSCGCTITSSPTDIIIDMDETSISSEIEKTEVFDTISEVQLPPILTKPRSSAKTDQVTQVHSSPPTQIVKENPNSTRKETRPSPRPRKLRANSPRIANKRVPICGRRSVSSKSQRKSFSQSLAIVKSSVDPQGDFKESMVEMIVEKNIRASKDLEDLLACYLSLNSDEYHEVIVKAFEQIWLDMAHLRL
ncbi:Transcription repressor like [Actinidia chinensis var. chinensis]|uniref:Transcription repressor n=1 Tax=Actinidia chinensis var. chinensis TaxID=1590841 RepID=A0A2R6P6G4_ACTCC|nr:Transcription repressor like [Actinidia chinensis var. chinensis]